MFFVPVYMTTDNHFRIYKQMEPENREPELKIGGARCVNCVPKEVVRGHTRYKIIEMPLEYRLNLSHWCVAGIRKNVEAVYLMSKMKLHLGCGPRHIPGYFHIDSVNYDHVDLVGDIRDLSQFESGSVSLIYACQVLEYFDREEVPKVLKEWLRALAVGGVLRLSVPNFEVICNLYKSGFQLSWFLGTLYGKIKNDEHGFIYHKTTYDEKSLSDLLIDNGFIEPRLWDWRETEHSHIDDFSQAYFPHMEKERGILFNLNMEVLKPRL